MDVGYGAAEPGLRSGEGIFCGIEAVVGVIFAVVGVVTVLLDAEISTPSESFVGNDPHLQIQPDFEADGSLV